jgi:hypothetical protein
MKLLTVLTALALVIEFNIVGRLTLTELILIVFAIGAMVQAPRATGDIAWFYIFAGLWAFGALVSDLFNQSNPNDFLRGWSKIAFLILNFTSLRLLIGRDIGRAVLFVYVLSVAGAIRLALGIVDPDLTDDVTGNAWKFGYGALLTTSAFLLSAWLQRRRIPRQMGIVPPFVSAAVALYLNARSLAGQTVLAVLVTSLTTGRRRISGRQLLLIATAGAVVGTGLLLGYEYAASEGWLGVAAQDKYFAQSTGTLSLLEAGRADTFASIQAILDSPLVGHGSWARDINYAVQMFDRLAAAGYRVNYAALESDLIPSHSHLLGAWVEHGVFGALFWLWALRTIGRALVLSLKRPTPLTGFVTYIAVTMIWDIVFSPFGLERRVTSAAWLYLLILVANDREAGGSPPAQEAPARPTPTGRQYQRNRS